MRLDLCPACGERVATYAYSVTVGRYRYARFLHADTRKTHHIRVGSYVRLKTHAGPWRDGLLRDANSNGLVVDDGTATYFVPYASLTEIARLAEGEAEKLKLLLAVRRHRREHSLPSVGAARRS